MTLADEGYQVLTATNRKEALDHMTARLPALALLDLQMPVMSGWKLVERLRALGLAVPIVFMTAGYRAQQEAERCGVAGYLAKPFDEETAPRHRIGNITNVPIVSVQPQGQLWRLSTTCVGSSAQVVAMHRFRPKMGPSILV
jgi:CheY-like chemotaxis protein